VIGGVYGLNVEFDAFIIAFEGVIWMLFLIGEESLGPAFLPVFMDAKQSGNEEKAWRFTSTIFNIQLLILLPIVALLHFFPQQTIDFLTRTDVTASVEDAAKQAQKRLLAIQFLGAMAPCLIGISLGSLTYMVLNGYKKFFWPAFADAALKIALVGGVVFGQRLGLNEQSLVVGALAAGVAKLSVHFFALGGKLKLYRPVIDFSDPYTRKFFMLVAPLLAGIVFAKVRDYYNNIYILSALEPGMVAINSNGRKIFNAIGSLVPYPLSIAMFPFFCELVERNDRASLGRFLTRSSRMLMLLFIPLAMVIFTLSEPLGRLIFETGKVDQASATTIGMINGFYCLVLPFTALEAVFMQAYFSTHRMGSVTVIGIVFSTLSMVVSYIGVVHYGMRGIDAVILVAVGFSISRALKTIALATLLKVQGLPLLPVGETIGFLACIALIGILAGAASFGASRGVEKVWPRKAPVVVADNAKKETPAPKAEPKADGDVSKDAPAKNDGKVEKKAEETSRFKRILNTAMKYAKTLGRIALDAALRLGVPGICAASVFVIGCKLLRLTELNDMIGYAKEKLNRRKKKNEPPQNPETPSVA
jgi:putative peptidoglycan lipid II flippase